MCSWLSPVPLHGVLGCPAARALGTGTVGLCASPSACRRPSPTVLEILILSSGVMRSNFALLLSFGISPFISLAILRALIRVVECVSMFVWVYPCGSW
jgi:hypothetical protein